MYGPVKDLTILQCASALASEDDAATSTTQWQYAARHPDTRETVLVAVDTLTRLPVLGVLDDATLRLLNVSFSDDGEFMHRTEPVSVVSFSLIDGDWVAVLVLSDGRIYRAAIEESGTDHPWVFEQIGAVGSGIGAAAWSPDHSTLVLVTGDGKRLVMSRDIEPLEEGPVQVTEFGSEEMISIGWGRKETQFHGTAGKQAAITPVSVPMAPVLESEDFCPRVSWRGDGALFAISTVDEGAGRRMRVYDRSGALLSTSEPTAGLEGALAWRPDGSLIASTQFIREQNRRQVVFFERNGLRHGEFVLPDDATRTVRALAWSNDSNILAVLYTEGVVELWSRANYHWYLKLQLPHRMVAAVCWDDESPTELLAFSHAGHVIRYHLVWDQHCAGSCVAVVDGRTVHLTPLGRCNIPPPMSLVQVSLAEPPLSVALRMEDESTVVLLSCSSTGRLALDRIVLGGRSDDCAIVAVGSAMLTEPLIQLQASADGFIGCSLDGRSLVHIAMMPALNVRTEPLPDCCWRVLNDGFVVLRDGRLFRTTPTLPTQMQTLASLGEWMAVLDEASTVVVLDEKGRLWANDRLVMTRATSCVHTDSFLLVTTHTHQLIFLPRSVDDANVWERVARQALESGSGETTAAGNEEIARRIERGALLVAAVPETASVVLQMPRGNLETFSPRAMLLAVLRKHLAALDYREAHALCRRHRIDMNILHDHQPELFMQTVGKFVRDVASVDHLNLFLSQLRDEDVAATKYAGFSHLTTGGHSQQLNTATPNAPLRKINAVSEAILSHLREDPVKWVDSIVTVYAVQQPPKLEAALSCISDLARVHQQPAETVERSLKYLLFLVPAERLFDVALGMYDLPLALSIARRSSKDPKEYVAFLEELATLSASTRQFRINDHLQRHSRALECLLADETVSFEDAVVYMEKHALYREAMVFTTATPPRHCRVMALFGAHLIDSDPSAAACCFQRAGDWERVKSLGVTHGLWREFLTACQRSGGTGEQVDALIATLRMQGRHQEAFQMAQLLPDSLAASDETKLALAIDGGLWREAALLAASSVDAARLVDALERHGQRIRDDLSGMAASLSDKSTRMLRVQRQFLAGPSVAGNVNGGGSSLPTDDGLSEMSFRTHHTQHTQRTHATTSSRRSGSSRKTERNRLRDKPGGAHEREFLLFALRELLTRICQMQTEVREVLVSLAAISPDTALSSARAIQTQFEALIGQTRTFVEEFRKLQVPRISHFNSLREPVDDAGQIVANPLMDPLEARFELPTDFGLNWRLALF